MHCELVDRLFLVKRVIVWKNNSSTVQLSLRCTVLVKQFDALSFVKHNSSLEEICGNKHSSLAAARSVGMLALSVP